jgi:hypothetical protein
MKLLGHPFRHEKIYFLSFCSVWCVSDNDSCFMQFENLINEFNLNIIADDYKLDEVLSEFLRW